MEKRLTLHYSAAGNPPGTTDTEVPRVSRRAASHLEINERMFLRTFTFETGRLWARGRGTAQSYRATLPAGNQGRAVIGGCTQRQNEDKVDSESPLFKQVLECITFDKSASSSAERLWTSQHP